MTRINKLSFIFAVLSIFATGLAHAQLANGGFESGTFPPWTTTGTASVSGTFGSQAPAEGSFQAVLSAPAFTGTVSQASLETFLGLTSGTLTAINDGSHHGGSAIQQTFTLSSPSVISFQWDFLPNGNNNSGQGNDFGIFTIHNSSSSSNMFTILSSTTLSGGTATKYQTFTTGVLASGSYLLGFAAYDNSSAFGPDQVDPNLLIDNVRVAAIPEPGTISLLVMAGLTAILLRRRRST